MAFQIKDFASIVASQINHARSVTTKVTDFQPGSVVRTIMEAPAVEIEELYLQMFLGLRDAIPVATFLSFGFDTLPPRRAHGYVTLATSTPPSQSIAIPLGTEFSTSSGLLFKSTSAATWPSGQASLQIPVQASVAGSSGNVAAGEITTSSAFGSTYTIGNPAISNGADTESSVERQARFAEFVQSLSRGTIVACMYAARQAVVLDGSGNIDQFVTRAGMSEAPGHVRIYLYSNIGSPSSALLTDGQRRIDGWRDDVAGTITPGYRAAGVRIDVLAMVERAVPLSIQVGMFPGYDLTTSVRQQLGDIFSSAIVRIAAGDTLYLGTLIELLLVVPGVRSIVPYTSSNIICDVTEALTPGTLTITAL